MGADVIVTEVDPIRALEAAMDGFRVMPMSEAAKVGDIFITATGDAGDRRRALHPDEGRRDPVQLRPFRRRDRSRVPATSYRDKVETRRHHATSTPTICQRPQRSTFSGQGRLVNLACAEGHPAQVMDMSFATQALASDGPRRALSCTVKVHDVPHRDRTGSRGLKLAAMGIQIDSLTDEQKKYLASWQTGT